MLVLFINIGEKKLHSKLEVNEVVTIAPHLVGYHSEMQPTTVYNREKGTFESGLKPTDGPVVRAHKIVFLYNYRKN